MQTVASGQITRLLKQVEHGDREATGELLSLLYDQLRALARQQMTHEPAGATLQPTALVHEAYLRLFGNIPLRCADRRAFFAAAAEAMRRVLIDRARVRRRLKRGAGRRRTPLTGLEVMTEADNEQILEIDDAVCYLEKIEPDIAAVVRLRFYGGLSTAETAEALGVSERTIYRDWLYGRGWLIRQLGYGSAPDALGGPRATP
jgi:RNA polymerase sigma factor (TIGR02999 family)